MITIRVSDEAWKKINQLREAGESIDVVVNRILNIKEAENVNEKHNPVD